MKQQAIKSQLESWQYTITWEIEEETLTSEKKDLILNQLKRVCNQEGILISHIKIDTTNVLLSLKSDRQLNINKFYKLLQKQMVTYVPEEHLRDGIIMCHSTLCAREDQRVNRLIDGICEVDYYDLDEGLIDEDIEQLKQYLKERQLDWIEQNNQLYLIDHKALQQKINLNCFECTKRHQYGCCCGSPCAMSEKNMNLLDQHLVPMEDALKALDEAQYRMLRERGGFVAANGEIRAFNGHCSFLIEHEGVYKCMAHKYALDEHIPIYDLCPLSCLMYPFEIMELITNKRKKVILLTSVVEETFAEHFGRWGSYKSLEVELRCIQEEAHDEVFRKEAYQPVYQVNQGLIRHEFGASLFKGMKQLLEVEA